MTDHEKHKMDIEDEVNRTLESLDSLSEVEAGPFFFTGVQQKLIKSGETEENWLGRLIFGYKLGPALLAVMILINIGTAYVALSGSNSESDDRSQYIEAIVDQYSLSTSSPLLEVGNE